MTILAIMAASVMLQGAWTWTLYEGDGPVVLANEVPDTAQLRSTFQCEPGSSVASIDLYGQPVDAGFATLTSGSASATGETESGGGRQSVVVRTDHPVFAQFVLTGMLDVSFAGQHRAIQVQPNHLAKLRRFAERCGG